MGMKITNLLPTNNIEAKMTDVFADYFLNK